MSESTEVATVEVGDKELERIEIGEGWSTTGHSVDSFIEKGNDRYKLAARIAKGGLSHHKTPEAVFTIMLAAHEMGIPVMQAMRGMYVVQGKLALEGHLMDGLAISRCGVTKKVVERSLQRCEIVFSRPGWEDYASEYDLRDAERAGLIKELNWETGEFKPAVKNGKPQMTWVKHTREMLYWRALSAGLKVVAPDFFGGLYHTDELSHLVPEVGDTSGARRDLAALVHGVEPDEAEFTEDEIDQFSREVKQAKKRGILSAQKARAMIDAIVAGKWKKCRDDQDAMRRAIAAANADKSGDGNQGDQGSLL